MIAKLHSQDDQMGQHRYESKRIAANILIGIPTLGLGLVGQLIRTKLSQGHATLFCDKTNRQTKIAAMEQTLCEIRVPQQA